MILTTNLITCYGLRCKYAVPSSFDACSSKPNRTLSSDRKYSISTRATTSYCPLHNFELAKGEAKHYQQQYGDMYFLRLAKLKPAVEEIAAEAWEGCEVDQEIFIRKEVKWLIKGYR